VLRRTETRETPGQHNPVTSLLTTCPSNRCNSSAFRQSVLLS